MRLGLLQTCRDQFHNNNKKKIQRCRIRAHSGLGITDWVLVSTKNYYVRIGAAMLTEKISMLKGAAK